MIHLVYETALSLVPNVANRRRRLKVCSADPKSMTVSMRGPSPNTW
jgi:hypothetical protein